MNKIDSASLKKTLFTFFFVFFYWFGFAQNQNFGSPTQDPFWSKVQFGGGIGLSFGGGYTDIGISPSAIYPLTEKVALGGGLQFAYIDSKGYYSSVVYGINALFLVNPIPEIQLSVGLSQSRVNYDYFGYEFESYSENYWVTGLILGVGYQTGNVTFGIGYNVIQDPYYDEPFVPFVRAYF